MAGRELSAGGAVRSKFVVDLFMLLHLPAWCWRLAMNRARIVTKGTVHRVGPDGWSFNGWHLDCGGHFVGFSLTSGAIGAWSPEELSRVQ